MKKIIMVIISIILLVFFSVLFLVLRNNKYINSLEKEIKDNYQVKEEIKYLNKFDLYYIIVTTDNLIVLDNDYQEVFKDDVSKMNKLDKDYEIVYRLNSVMYEVKNISESKITYEYYDIYTNELIDIVEVGG